MKESTLRLFILLTPFAAGLLLGFLVGNCSGRHYALRSEAEGSASVAAETAPSEEETEQDSSNVYEEPQMKEIIYHTHRISYSTEFADLNEVHLQTARKVGLPGIPGTRDDVAKSNLTEIVNNDYHVIDKLRYSVPYLTARTAAELDTISKAFNDSLWSKRFPEYKLVVSSVLRTGEDIARLRRSGNPNASDNSAHCYGTTFDISYTRISVKRIRTSLCSRSNLPRCSARSSATAAMPERFWSSTRGRNIVSTSRYDKDNATGMTGRWLCRM